VRGNVLGFDRDTNTGAISGHDGNRYEFVTLDWRGAGLPRRGDLVDFQAIEQRATEIHLIAAVYVRPSLADFYFSPYGRISRSQLWLWWVLPYTGITLVGRVIEAIAGYGSAVGVTVSLVLGLFGLVALWPSIAVQIKRIHDRNKSGWLILVYLIPMVLFMIVLVVWVGGAFVAMGRGEDAATAFGSLGVLGGVAILLGAVVFCIAIWFFVEFGCMRGTIGPNRFGPDPVSR
jgi:uncharacterized membrane protein YhaH (DUF805 family)